MGLIEMVIFGVIPFAAACRGTGWVCSGDFSKTWAWKIPRIILIWVVFGGYAFLALRIASHLSGY